MIIPRMKQNLKFRWHFGVLLLLMGVANIMQAVILGQMYYAVAGGIWIAAWFILYRKYKDALMMLDLVNRARIGFVEMLDASVTYVSAEGFDPKVAKAMVAAHTRMTTELLKTEDETVELLTKDLITKVERIFEDGEGEVLTPEELEQHPYLVKLNEMIQNLEDKKV